MESSTKEFLIELGELLKKHDAEIVINKTKEGISEIEVITDRFTNQYDSYYLGDAITEEGLHHRFKRIK